MAVITVLRGRITRTWLRSDSEAMQSQKKKNTKICYLVRADKEHVTDVKVM